MIKIDFIIENIDSLGQGVSKIGDKITFIPKTLPGEEGSATLYRQAKGVQFAYIKSDENILVKADNRQASPCPHFDQCHSCNFLHTDYESEIRYKTISFKRMLTSLDYHKDPIIHAANDREGYRNRVQLHYDKKKNQLGLINPITNQIIAIPNCKLPNKVVKDVLQNLYKNQSWQKLVSSEKNRGHIELYSRNELECKIECNRPYAAGGFTQVNSDMNEKMQSVISSEFQCDETDSDQLILDLFGGSGNLTKNLGPSNVIVVDSYTPNKKLPEHQEFLELNLYSKDALRQIEQKISQKVSTIILDPPRSGLKNLDQFVEKLRPKELFYISCNPASMIRDLKKLSTEYQINSVHFFDLFPSTFHFESFIHFKHI